MSVRIEGLAEARAALVEAASKLHSSFVEAVGHTTDDVASEARRLAPVDTGRLRASITARSMDLDGEAETSSPYAAYVEFGTSRAPAQPFLAPAAEIVRRRFVGRIHDAGKAVE